MPRDPIKLLITGFEPFGGSTLNPSQAIVEAAPRLQAALGPGVRLRSSLLPVDARRVGGVLKSLWARHEPRLVLHLGESAKADRLTLERVAVNLLDFTTPDNAGRRVTDTKIAPNGPDAYFATLPLRKIHDQLAKQGIDTTLSLSAGAYLCNQVLYLSLRHAQRRGGLRVGFVHVPCLPEQIERGERDGPSMPQEQLLGEVQNLIAAVLN